jgi:hypothetical protein
MSKVIGIALAFNGAAFPQGVALDHVVLEITDASGAQLPAISLNGTESPTPWYTQATVADGAGSINAQQIDGSGAVIGTPIDVPYDTESAPVETNQLSGLSVTVVGDAPAAPAAQTKAA